LRQKDTHMCRKWITKYNKTISDFHKYNK
jgi:hypothetical protein